MSHLWTFIGATALSGLFEATHLRSDRYVLLLPLLVSLVEPVYVLHDFAKCRFNTLAMIVFERLVDKGLQGREV